jgi:hypothetical protein
MAKASSSKIAAKRKEYAAVKALYKKAGKKAFGKPKTSIPHREYKTVKREYNRIGGELGRMTGKKPRR